MHQLPRPSSSRPSALDDSLSNTNRSTENTDTVPVRTRSSVDLASYNERHTAEDQSLRNRQETVSGSQEKEHKRLNQIIQNFHTKAALTICSARATLPLAVDRNGDTKQNRWFSLILDDTDILAAPLLEWKQSDSTTCRPPPLIIEIYLDTSQLNHNQVLVISDENGRRWDVSEALSQTSTTANTASALTHEIVIERWTISLDDGSGHSAAELNDTPPNIYKKGVVMFRSLHAVLRMLPAWKLYRRLARIPGGKQNLKLNYRIQSARSTPQTSRFSGSLDSLYMPLFPSQHSSNDLTNASVQRYAFESLKMPVGLMSVTVDYRNSTLFSVIQAESLLSSRFMGLDQGVPVPHAAGKSLPGPRVRPSFDLNASSFGNSAVEGVANRSSRGVLGAYGSLGTFHVPEKRASPVTELRQRVIHYEEEDEALEETAARNQTGTRHRPRSSVDLIRNPPFKAGSLTSTPPRSSPLARNLPSPTTSTLSNYANSQTSDRTRPGSATQRNMVPPTLPGSAPTMLAQTKKYSSSFSDRKPRYVPGSVGSGIRRAVESDETSVGEESRPNSGDLMLMGATPGSYSSRRLSSATSSAARSAVEPIVDDMDSISQFLSDLDEAAKQSRQGGTSTSDHSRPTSKAFSVDLTQFSKYRSSGSSLVHNSQKTTAAPTPPSRRLSNVPPLSTSPSPHGLIHTPVVRSRLSTQSVTEGSASLGQDGADSLGAQDEDYEDEPFIFGHDMD